MVCQSLRRPELLWISAVGIDALARATEIKAVDVELLARRYPGRRGIARARQAMELFDTGAHSPKESWLRVILIQAGLPRPQTQIPVLNEFARAIAYLDMGWENVRVAVEYDGEQHRTERRQYTWDVRRLEMLERRGWIVVRVVAGDRPAEIVGRVREAFARRLCA
jgi:very-short-patch-repair endonuclease